MRSWVRICISTLPPFLERLSGQLSSYGTLVTQKTEALTRKQRLVEVSDERWVGFKTLKKKSCKTWPSKWTLSMHILTKIVDTDYMGSSGNGRYQETLVASGFQRKHWASWEKNNFLWGYIKEGLRKFWGTIGVELVLYIQWNYNNKSFILHIYPTQGRMLDCYMQYIINPIL